MSKTIVIISSTPRKNGNSDILSDEFMKGARDAGHYVEKIRLSEKNINYCTGCCTCIGKPGKCVQQDEMNDILAKLLKADILVFASPVYFRSFNGQMKTFIDRVCPIYPMIHNKDVYLIASAAGGSLPVNSTFDSFRVFTDCLDVQEKGTVSVTGLWDAGKVQNTKAMGEAYRMGKNA